MDSLILDSMHMDPYFDHLDLLLYQDYSILLREIQIRPTPIERT